MSRPDEGEAGLYAVGHRRRGRQVPFALRLVLAALFAAILALGASYSLRILNL